jgi:methionyl aminopeptidase
MLEVVICKTFKDKERMRAAGRSAAAVLDRLCAMVAPGISTWDLDEAGGEIMKDLGIKSACKGYRSGHRIFPSYTCLSVNEEVVHGIGVKDRILKEGDIISVDVCVRDDGFVGDNCRTVPVGKVAPEVARLLRVTEESLYAGLVNALHKNRVGDISHGVQKHVEAEGFAVITNFVGHGVGRTLHEDPQIPNFGRAGSGIQLRKGMAICVEPMVNTKSAGVRMADDGWTALAEDNLPSAHFEHTLLVDEGTPEILTLPPGYDHSTNFLEAKLEQLSLAVNRDA